MEGTRAMSVKLNEINGLARRTSCTLLQDVYLTRSLDRALEKEIVSQARFVYI